MERWLKVSKCHSLALCAPTVKLFDPELSLHGQPIHFIGQASIKFLGVMLQVQHPDPYASCEETTKHGSRGRHCICDCLTSPLLSKNLPSDELMNDLPLSWLRHTLERDVTRSLKNKELRTAVLLASHDPVGQRLSADSGRESEYSDQKGTQTNIGCKRDYGV